MLRASRVPTEFINAAKAFRCDACDDHQKKPQTHKVAPPKPYVFNYEVGLDAFEVKDAVGTRYTVLNVVCMGVTFQLGWIVRAGGGTPSSRQCLKMFITGWTSWAGWPKILTLDRGLHNRGIFAATARRNGAYIREAGLEAPEQIGRVERRGQMLKAIVRRMVTEKHIVGLDDMETALSEALNAGNEMSRTGGFAPSQWVLGRLPRNPGAQGDEDEFADVGTIQGQVDGFTAFGHNASYRASARKAFVKYDCGLRVSKAFLRKAAPVPGNYQVGDLVSFCREPRKGEAGRLIGFEGARTCWIICDGLPVCVAKEIDFALRSARKHVRTTTLSRRNLLNLRSVQNRNSRVSSTSENQLKTMTFHRWKIRPTAKEKMFGKCKLNPIQRLTGKRKKDDLDWIHFDPVKGRRNNGTDRSCRPKVPATKRVQPT